MPDCVTVPRSPPVWLEESPPSVKLVVTVLRHEGQLTQAQLAEKTRLAKRTVRYAINRLQENDAIEESIYIGDARKRLYSLTEPIASDN